MKLTMKTAFRRLLEAIRLDTLAYELREGTLFSNRQWRRPADYMIPRGRLLRLVAGTTDANRFLWSGRLATTRILDLLNADDTDLRSIRTVLDFGCGCGRIARHLLRLKNGGLEIYGLDTDENCVTWCKKHLKPGRFLTSDARPPLPLDGELFDLVISYSVFTHIHADDQLMWFRELGRVIRPGGLLVFSTHPGTAIKADDEGVTPELYALHERGQVVSLTSAMKYTNRSNYGIFHPPGSVPEQARASGVFEHRLTVPGLEAPPLDGAGHDLHLWKKVSG